VDYDELQSKLTSQGPVAVERAERDFGGHAEISIPMRYQLALL
jgi:hypothetical protein